jgi:hypothetical protein
MTSMQTTWALALVSGLALAGTPAAAATASEGRDWRAWGAGLRATLSDSGAWSERAHWRLAGSPYTYHFRWSEEHRRVWAVALERQRDDGWLAGFSRFSNSFGQPSAYLYLGHRFDQLWGVEQLFGQVSGGLLYGYRGRFEDKVPLNNNGFSPGALVSLGWQFNPQVGATAHLLGDAGVMLQLSWDFR